jgi:integrase
MRLNKTAVDRLPHPDKGFTLTWDSTLPGFGVRTTKNVKTFIAQTRVSGKSRRVSIGRHGVITADQARRSARHVLGRMAEGKDPAEEKRLDAENRARTKALSVTLKQVWNEYRNSRRKDGKTRKQSTLDDIESHLNRNFQEWLDSPITEITRDGVLNKHKAIAKRGTYQADQAMRYLRSLLNYARDLHTAPDGEPCLPNNPVDVLRSARAWHAPQRRRNVIPRGKLGAVVTALETIATAPEEHAATRTCADLVLFLLFTGLRFTEGAALEWSDVDTDTWSIALPDPKNRRPTTLPLSEEAACVLQRRPDDDCVFPGRSNGHIGDTRSVRSRVAEATGVEFTNHDLRRTFASIAAEQDVGEYTLKRLLNHAVSSADVTGGYVSTDFESQRAAANRICRFIRSRADAEQRDNVVPIRERA